MSNLYKYLLSNLSSTFFPIFLTLFAITSIIFLVKIAALTSVITMNAFEMMYLYLLNTPLILFYSLPISYFVAAILSISKISSEYELIVINSFGISPLKIMKNFIPISLLMSILLFIISFILIPKATCAEQIFKNKKQQEAKFNIKPSEYGQKFGPWYIYVANKHENTYSDIILYQNKETKNTFISAKKAVLINNTNSITLVLSDGTSSIITDKLKIVRFSKMTIDYNLPDILQITTLKDIINFWLKIAYKDELLRNIFITILPILSILLYISLGYYNPRYQKNHSTAFAIFFLILYIAIMQKLSKSEMMDSMIYFPIFWIILSIFIYFKRVKKFF